MGKKMIHKIKWHVVKISGWYISPNQVKNEQGYHSLCCSSPVTAFRIAHKRWGRLEQYWGNGAIKWKYVTCKNCLKMRK